MAEDRDLLPGETVLLQVTRHPVVMARRAAVPAVVALVILAGGAFLPLHAATGTLRWFVLLVFLIGFLVYLDVQFIIWRSETLTVTDQRVLYRRGVFGRFSRSTALTRVQDVTTAQGLVGRMLNYGTVEVESAARDGAEVFDHVPDPANFRNVLFEAMHGNRGPVGQGL
ncbi:MAG: PH domain-containing protein [Candidatus Dormibacteria bacterium]